MSDAGARRQDLLSLTAEALASLANLGLVKRAQRELAAGQGPLVTEDADGAVVATFQDGVVARLAAGTPLKAASCSCGAQNTCRHRVALVLGYKAVAEASASPLSASPAGTIDVPAWWPGDIDDETLGRALSDAILERARLVLRRGLLVTVEGGAVPTAKLPSCTVRFLVPRDVAYAKCDCVLSGAGCEHLALAVWAFRQASAGDAAQVLTLGQSRADAGTDALAASVHGLLRELLSAGVAKAHPSPTRFALLRAELEKRGMTWLFGCVRDLQIALEGYQARSALHGTREIASLLVEIAARLRAARSSGAALPPRFVLGEDEAPETRLDHVRLVSLGARVRADERSRLVDVYLADPDTSLCLVLHKRWDFEPEATLENGPELARRLMAGGATLKALAHGQIVSKAVSRSANRTIELGRTRVAQTSVSPQRGDFAHLPAPLLIGDLAAHEAYVKTLPPRFLRPRVLAENMHVVAIAALDDIVHSAAEQTLRAFVRDGSGAAFQIVVRHKRAAPHALEATAAALARGTRFVAGELHRTSRGWEMEPTALATDELVLPELAGPAPTPVALDAGTIGETRDGWDVALTSAGAVLEELASVGLLSPKKATLDRLEAAAHALENLGASGLGARLRELWERLRGQPAPAADAKTGDLAVDAWLDASVRLALVQETPT